MQNMSILPDEVSNIVNAFQNCSHDVDSTLSLNFYRLVVYFFLECEQTHFANIANVVPSLYLHGRSTFVQFFLPEICREKKS